MALCYVMPKKFKAWAQPVMPLAQFNNIMNINGLASDVIM